MMARRGAVPAPPVTVAEAAAQLGVYRQRVDEWIRKGLIEAICYPGCTIRIDQAEVDRFKKKHTIPAAP